MEEINSFDSYLKGRLSQYTIKDNTICGYIDGEDSFQDFFKTLKALGYSYSVRRSDNRAEKKAENIWFLSNPKSNCRAPPIEFMGNPFSIEKTTDYECSQGPKYYKKKEHANFDHPHWKKKRVDVFETKKLGCTAWMTVKCVRIYTNFVAAADDWKLKKKVSQDVKEAMRNKLQGPTALRYYLRASIEETHNHSKISSEMNQRIHPTLVTEIKNIVESGITSPRDIKLLLQRKVQQEFPGETKPNRLNTAFYPSDSVIYSQIFNAVYVANQNIIDQEALEEQVKAWKQESPDTLIYFRPFKTDEDGVVKTLVFCYQASWQKQLLHRYGRLCLLDATYRTTKYSLPLFFLCVKTNVGYTVVGIFVIQAESTDLISEALSIFKNWCPDWHPEFFMTDYSEMEISAIETIFPTAEVYLCAFHREQAWQRWLKKSGNVKNDKGGLILAMWRKIASSRTEEIFNDNVTDMKCSPHMENNEQAMFYFNTHWLAEAKRWVHCFSKKQYSFTVNTNNGVEAQNKVLKHSYLCHTGDHTLTGMLKVVVNKYVPDSLRKYSEKNSVIKSYNSEIPAYLHNRPAHFIRHVMQRKTQAENEILKSMISSISDGVFSVVSSSNSDVSYTVDFSSPICSCPDFQKYIFPCKHMCAVFQHYPQWGFESLNEEYLASPYITIDFTHSHHIQNFSHKSNEVPDSNDSSGEVEEHCEEMVVMTSEDNLKKLQESLRNAAKQIIDVSYLCTDTNVLRNATNILLQQKQIIDSLLPTSSGLILQNQTNTQAAAVRVKRKYGILQKREKRKRS